VAGPDDDDFVVIDVPLGFKLTNVNLISASSLGGQLNIELSDFDNGAALGALSQAFQNEVTGLTSIVEMLNRSFESGEYLLKVSALTSNVTYSIQAMVEADEAARASLFSTFSNGIPVFIAGEKFAGSPSLNLDYQIIDTSSNAIIVGSSLNDFIVLQGTGNKAVDGGRGADVIDGGTGSTFISGGGTGDSDTFFLDGRAAGAAWSTITDFELGLDKATIWGWKAGVSKVNAAFSDFNTGGAEGFTGLTLHFDNLLPDGSSATATNPNLNSITFTGLELQDFGVSSLAELNTQLTNQTNSHFQVSSVTDAFGEHGYLYIS
jgi:Ca2+-binding RTX toxin-like protein